LAGRVFTLAIGTFYAYLAPFKLIRATLGAHIPLMEQRSSTRDPNKPKPEERIKVDR